MLNIQIKIVQSTYMIVRSWNTIWNKRFVFDQPKKKGKTIPSQILNISRQYLNRKRCDHHEDDPLNSILRFDIITIVIMTRHVKYSGDCIKVILKQSIYHYILFAFKYLY